MKRKTHKMLAKKFKVTGTGKLLQRHSGQNHFNARETGNATRHKRNDSVVGKAFRKSIAKFLPTVNVAK